MECKKEGFPERLKWLMSVRKVSQSQLGDMLGSKRQTISLYITGKSKPDIEALLKIADYFGVSCDYLLGVHDEPSPNADIQGLVNATGLSPLAITHLCTRYKDSQTLSAILESNGLFKVLFSIDEVMRLKRDPRYDTCKDMTDEETRAYSKMHDGQERETGYVVIPQKQWMHYRVYQAVDDFKDIAMNYCFPEDKEE